MDNLVSEDPSTPAYCISCGVHIGGTFYIQGKPVEGRCDSCNDKAYAAHTAIKKKSNPNSPEARWLKDCPPRLQELDQNWMVHHQPVIKHVLDWAPNHLGQGIYLSGYTGAGKSNAMHLLMDRLVRSRGMECMPILAIDLGRELVSAARGKSGDGYQTLYRTKEVPVLLIDDLGQQRINKSFREGLFEILDYRINHRRATFITSNYQPAEIIRRFDEAQQQQDGSFHMDGQDALMRRLFQNNFQYHLPKPLPAQYQPLPT